MWRRSTRLELTAELGVVALFEYARAMVGRLARVLGFIATAAVLTGAVARAWRNLDSAAPLVGELGPSSVAVASDGKASRPVLLVVIDGLRADVAATLPFLSRLGDAGGRAATWDDPPTYSAAQYVALLAGVPPRDSGVRTNETLRAAGVDDVARRVRVAGMHTAAVSTCVDWWRRLFPESFESADVVASPAIVSEVGRLRGRGGLVLVHLCGVDDAGHAHGARSPEYAAAAAAADGMTAALADAWGWPRADVVVTADHGHRDRGGHGGEEPEVRASFIVAAGPDVQPGARVDGARSVDSRPRWRRCSTSRRPGRRVGGSWSTSCAFRRPSGKRSSRRTPNAKRTYRPRSLRAVCAPRPSSAAPASSERSRSPCCRRFCWRGSVHRSVHSSAGCSRSQRRRRPSSGCSDRRRSAPRGGPSFGWRRSLRSRSSRRGSRSGSAPAVGRERPARSRR